jgi:ABC-type amino acid transport substrate-binding protein
LNVRPVLLAFVVAIVPALAAAQSPEGRLKKIKDSKTIAIAYRTDATPFSFVDEAKQPTGYSIDLCKRVVAAMEQQLGTPGLQVKWVPVTVQTRFDAVARGDADMECGSSTVTLTRMKQVDFSNYIFLDGTGILARAEYKASTLADLAGKKIGVIGGTTNEAALRNALKARVVNATVVTLNQREEGLAKLESKEIDAFASDQILLLGLGPKAKDPKALAMVDDMLSFEPYGIVLPRGESGFRSEVNSALARIYRSNAIDEIYGRWFASLGKPPAMLRVMYTLGAIPD